MYIQFYNKYTERLESARGVRKSTGVDPQTSGSLALETLGIFPVSEVDQPFNASLYDFSVSWDTSTGYALKNWTPTAKTLADVIESAKRQRTKTNSARIRLIRSVSKLGSRVIEASDGIDDTVRPARFDKWVDRISSTLTELDSDLTAIEGAATVEAINNIVSAAHGTVTLALDSANPLNLLAGDFDKFYSKNYAKTDLELFFPSTSTTLAYSSGFAATASVVTADDPIVQIRVASTGVVVDEIELVYRSSSDVLPSHSFGFLKYDHEDEDIFDYKYAPKVKEFTVTVSNNKFVIDGSENSELDLIQSRTYRFNQEDSSNSGHPLRIYSDSDKVIEIVGRVVAVGTPGTAGAYTEYTPASVGEFSYQCSNHAEMGSYITVYEYWTNEEGEGSGGGGGY